MADGVTIDVSEVRRLAFDLNLKNARVALEAAVVVKDAAEHTRDLARRQAPVRTGALRDSIRMTGRGLSRRVRSDVRYAKYVEYGTHTRGGPQPFLMPAAERGEERLIRGLQDVAAKGL